MIEKDAKTVLYMKPVAPEESEQKLHVLRRILKALGCEPHVSRFGPDDIRLRVEDRKLEPFMNEACQKGIDLSLDPHMVLEAEAG